MVAKWWGMGCWVPLVSKSPMHNLVWLSLSPAVIFSPWAIWHWLHSTSIKALSFLNQVISLASMIPSLLVFFLPLWLHILLLLVLFHFYQIIKCYGSMRFGLMIYSILRQFQLQSKIVITGLESSMMSKTYNNLPFDIFIWTSQRQLKFNIAITTHNFLHPSHPNCSCSRILFSTKSTNIHTVAWNIATT